MAHFYKKLLSEKACRLFETHVQIPMSALNFSYNRDRRKTELYIPAQYFGQTINEGVVRDIYRNQGNNQLFSSAAIHSQSGKQWVQLSLDPKKLAETVLGLKAQQRTPVADDCQTIVVEFSSPNIAKPFHAGHLRSTIIGNFISNVNEFFGNRVVRLNYLGDWGTQFGYLALGVRLKELSPVEIKQNPMQCLYEAYVHAHSLAENDAKIHEAAKDIFAQMEHGAIDELQHWREYREHTVNELEALYHRLGVRFNSYEWESQYRMRNITEVVNTLKQNDVLQDQSDGRQVVQLNNRTVPLIKSDGSGMYLLRDIAALIDRHKRYSFHRSLYVVENGQNDHFTSLNEIAGLLQLPNAPVIEHIKFGRIHGMSTRRGKVVFLKDILLEAQQLVQEKQRKSPNTKKHVIDDPNVCEILGASAVIINDLKQRRLKDYDFEWSRILQMDGDSGIKLQYTHCRLSSLLSTQIVQEGLPSIMYDSQWIPEPEAAELICHILNFEPACSQAQQSLEACVLVNYLFRLCKSVNLALKALPIKHEPSPQKRMQRILLFSQAQNVLRTAMELLGLKPLDEM
ncbi:probable arginine--tRNA ligase, mitochondrial [Anopheles cruzii]|uniref:probable arginine--tRNA ligase, mitochondrial n=1 Tax=Anopheles cruzii TaxID=68878 RepID=UPI0022EC4459|nr:probable arginine--tRNA ligase, mitochondrial [Anopheles cruzii]